MSLIGQIVFFFNDTATTEIYTLSLHDALPISTGCRADAGCRAPARPRCIPMCPRTAWSAPASTRTARGRPEPRGPRDRKSTRLNSSHSQISYAVFCLKKKNTLNTTNILDHDYY